MAVEEVVEVAVVEEAGHLALLVDVRVVDLGAEGNLRGLGAVRRKGGGGEEEEERRWKRRGGGGETFGGGGS